ncbi:MAG: hypothetical protein KGY40_07115, partial [Thioalkalivibrio sp.]|nr:hypothetical protein [Thioalkalivibrio sp.]
MTDQDSSHIWHAQDTGAALDALAASSDGLSSETARERLEQHGPNRLPEPERNGPFRRLLSQF